MKYSEEHDWRKVRVRILARRWVGLCLRPQWWKLHWCTIPKVPNVGEREWRHPGEGSAVCTMHRETRVTTAASLASKIAARQDSIKVLKKDRFSLKVSYHCFCLKVIKMSGIWQTVVISTLWDESARVQKKRQWQFWLNQSSELLKPSAREGQSNDWGAVEYCHKAKKFRNPPQMDV